MKIKRFDWLKDFVFKIKYFKSNITIKHLYLDSRLFQTL